MFSVGTTQRSKVRARPCRQYTLETRRYETKKKLITNCTHSTRRRVRAGGSSVASAFTEAVASSRIIKVNLIRALGLTASTVKRATLRESDI